MASAAISYHLDEYDYLEVQVDSDSTSPDVLTDVNNRAATLFATALNDVMTMTRDRDDTTTS
jgi:hypothetical protein